nr:hypothetical protein [Mycolicibacterium duvalii]
MDENKLNVSGGAIALGHPFGMTGADHRHPAQQPGHPRQDVRHRETCVGGGQGMAMVVERLVVVGWPGHP